MVKPTWRILAFSALMAAVALPASAQVVIGGSGQPSVEVNWAVLDSLGRQPTLADMLKDDMPVKQSVVASKLPGQQQAVTYRPYQTAPAKKTAAAEPRKKAKVTPVAAKVEPAAALSEQVRAAQKPEPKQPAPAQIAQKPATPVADAPGPQIALPEIAPPAKPTQIAKVEPPPAVAAKPEPVKPEPGKPAAPPAIAKVEPAPAVAKVEPAPAPTPAAAPAPAMVASVPTPAPVAKTEPAPAPQVAALPSASVVSAKGDTLSLMFADDQAKLPAGAHADLQALARRMEKDEGLGLQLLAYASGDESGASKARRLSLSRALEVRKFLMEQGVRSTRIEVRALGNKLEGSGPADRVDAVVVNR